MIQEYKLRSNASAQDDRCRRLVSNINLFDVYLFLPAYLVGFNRLQLLDRDFSLWQTTIYNLN